MTLAISLLLVVFAGILFVQKGATIDSVLIAERHSGKPLNLALRKKRNVLWTIGLTLSLGPIVASIIANIFYQ